MQILLYHSIIHITVFSHYVRSQLARQSNRPSLALDTTTTFPKFPIPPYHAEAPCNASPHHIYLASPSSLHKSHYPPTYSPTIHHLYLPSLSFFTTEFETMNKIGTIRDQYEWQPKSDASEWVIEEEKLSKVQPLVDFINHAGELKSTKVGTD